ncbi:MAG: mobilization protein [Puia sp.]|nr:mobilization protein [Puia sp.]
MEEQKTITKKKGGRPKKAVKKDQLLAVKCSLYERRAIEARAKSANLSISEYLREISLTGKIDRREKALPKEVLELTGTLNHMAANLNQIAKKRNGVEELNALERATLKVQSGELKGIAAQIKTFLL